MNQKIRSGILPVFGLLGYVFSFTIAAGGETLSDIPWDALEFWGGIVTYGIAWAAKSPADAHKIDKNGGGN